MDKVEEIFQKYDKSLNDLLDIDEARPYLIELCNNNDEVMVQ